MNWQLISPQDMRDMEKAYFAAGVEKSIDVMERAAQAVADVISTEIPAGSRVYFACGLGGNGGDGLACARLLRGKYDCVVYTLPGEFKTPDARENLRRAKECGVPVFTFDKKHYGKLFHDPDHRPAAWVDAIFGTGQSRVPEGDDLCCLIYLINNVRQDGDTRVYAVDIPTGLNGATGKAYYPHCIRADRTIALQYMKLGHKLGDGFDVCGEITVAGNIFPIAKLIQALTPKGYHHHSDRFVSLMDWKDIPRKPRPRNIHKNTCGHLLIVAGSFGMAGAAAMCAEAALRSGVGLVTLACVRSIVPILQTLVPQAMCVPLEEKDGAISVEAMPKLQSALEGKDAVAVGPGLSRRACPGAVYHVLKANLPTVIDADALNILSENRELFRHLNDKHVLTPHPGEAARLIPGLDVTDPVNACRRLTNTGATVLLKGPSSVICHAKKETYISASGCQGMARGGSGDILSGIMGALLANPSGCAPFVSAAFASEIHGRAGELAQAKYGAYGMNARDIIEFIPEVMK